MILIMAKIKCDHWECDNVTADVEVEFREGVQGIPILSAPYMPDGWRFSNFNEPESHQHYCPKHPEKKRF
jgi:hypothetical protein